MGKKADLKSPKRARGCTGKKKNGDGERLGLNEGGGSSTRGKIHASLAT